MKVIIAIDQGTSSTRTLAFNLKGECIASSQLEITQHYPQDGWVEHCAEEIYNKTAKTLTTVINDVQNKGFEVACVGLTNQRETTVVWHKKTGIPIYNAIVWQDRRTKPYCDRLQKHTATVKTKTGLPIDPYFSATKIKWILEHCHDSKTLVTKGELACGTIDSYLIWRLTDGKDHKTDVTNASRTLLYDINTFKWDSELLNIFDIPLSILPEVMACDASFGKLSFKQFKCSAPITGVIGDQQAASIGQQCFNEFDAKMTFGSGAFLMVNTNKVHCQSENLLSTVAYKIKNNFAYALEGSIFNAGTIIKWLKDKQSLISSEEQAEELAGALEDNGNVYFIPAFTGLGAPHWQPKARGMVLGLQLDTKKAHIIRAALESVAYQTNDLLQTLKKEQGISLNSLKIDGGMSINKWLMTFIADLCQLTLVKSSQKELTAVGAAMIAGLGAGIFNQLTDYSDWYIKEWQVVGDMPKPAQYKQWLAAVNTCKLHSHTQ